MDDADRAGLEEEQQDEIKARQREAKPFVLDPGTPGECELCGEWSGRLIKGACAPCRDRYRL